MKRHVKKLLLLFAAMGILATTAVGVGCKKAEEPGPQFLKGILQEIELGSGIDMTKYIQYVTDSTYTITVSKDGYSEELTYKKYWEPEEPGVYTITYTIHDGEYKGTNSFELTVNVPPISWSYTLDNHIYDVGDTLIFSEYVESMNITVTSYYPWKFVMDSVTASDMGTVSLENADSWTFTEAGKHRFKFYVQSEDGQTISMSQSINVRLIESEMQAWMDANNVTSYNALRLENGGKILLNEGIYDEVNSTSQPRAETTVTKDMPYVAYNGEYGLNDFVVVDFTGNNMPYVLFFGEEITNNVFYRVGGTEAENKGLVFVNGWTYGTGEPVTSWVNSLNTRFSVYGPQKIWRADMDVENWFRMRIDGATGMGMTSILNDGPEDEYRLAIGITEGTENSFTVALHCLNVTKGTVLFSGQQTIAIDATSGAFGADYFSGKIALYGAIGKTTQLDKVYEIQEDTTLEEIKEKFFKTSSFKANVVTKVALNQTLNVSDYIAPDAGANYTLKIVKPNGTEEAVLGDTFAFVLPGWNALQYSDGVNAAIRLNVFVANETPFSDLQASGYKTSKNAGGQYVLGASTHNGSTTKNPDASTSWDMSYLAFNGEYGLNDYVVFDFTGNNMPYISFFNGEVTNSMYYDYKASAAQNKGLLLVNGATNLLGGPVEAWNKERGVNDRITFAGPTKVGGIGTDVPGFFRSNVARGDVPVGVYMLSKEENANKRYRAIVGFTEGTTAGCTLVMYVFDLDTGKVVMDVQHKEIGTFTEDCFNGSIVLYGHYGKETVLDAVYAIEENVTLEDLKEEYYRVSKFKPDAETIVIVNQTLNVSDYIVPVAGVEYTFMMIDGNGTQTPITEDTFTFTAAGQYELRYFDGVNLAMTLNVSVVEPLQFESEYNFEDDYVPTFLHNDASWSTNGGSEVVSYNGSKVFKSWGDHTYQAFNLDKEYMDWAFLNKFVAVSFDLTVEFDESRGYLALQIQGTNTPNYYFGPGQKQTITITKKMYDAWLTSGMSFLRVLAQNQDGGMVTYYVDNVKAAASTVVESFDYFASAYAYNQISDSTATSYIDYIGFYYTGSGGNCATGLVPDSHPVKQGDQSKYIVSAAGPDIANVDDDGAFMLRATNYRLTYYFSMQLLDYVFGVDESVSALAWDLKHYTDCDGTEKMPIKTYAVIDGKPIDPSTNEVLDWTHATKPLTELEDVKYYDYNVWSTCTITRAEYQALKDAGATHIVFRVLGEHATSLANRTRVLLDNFRFVLSD